MYFNNWIIVRKDKPTKIFIKEKDIKIINEKFSNHVKISFIGRIKFFFNKIIFRIQKFLLKIILDDYSRILISQVLTDNLPILRESEREFNNRTPDNSLTEQDILDIREKNSKDILYTNTLIHNYLI